MSPSLYKYMIESIRPSIKINTDLTYHHIAVLARGNKILAVGTNKMGGRSCGPGYSYCTCHAEVDVLKKLGDFTKLRGADLYVWRLNPQSTRTLNSKPCSDCMIILEKCIRSYGLKRVFYSSGGS
jgi:pyrimidine deaminase RibD-like protein